jgi:DNA-binding MarR family transcriptional regulator
VQRLVNDGLAERRPSGDDGRVVMVAVSEEGRRRHGDVAERRVAAMGRILAAFTPDERARLADLMMRLVHSIDELVADLVVEQQDAEDASDATGATTTPAAKAEPRRAR